MCRIAGIISKKLTRDELLLKINSMNQTLAHGGPDDEGIYHNNAAGMVFGHRRLSIIDLSNNGHQPMADAHQQVWITFNGEIYNYLQLKDELLTLGAKFISDTDTEVIIQAYLIWGTNCFSKLRGMFAFALHDVKQALTYLVRDTSGIKPLYYHINDEQLSFASEVKALKEAGLGTETDHDWPIRFLAFGHIPEPYTTQKNVFSLPKGHWLCWQHGDKKHQISPYQINAEIQNDITDSQLAQQEIRHVLSNTVKRQLLADAPIGVFLSGGTDSSLLTLLAHQHKKEQLKTVSIYFDELVFNELQYQNIILDKTNIENHQHLVKQQDFEQALPDIIAGMDMPTTDGINSWFISKYASQSGLKAVLSGLGADELFGGYPSFRRIKYLKYLKAVPNPMLHMAAAMSKGRFKRLALLKYKHPLAEYLFLRGLFTPADIAKILNISERRVCDVLFAPKMDLKHLSDTQKAAWLETNLYMQNQLLRDTDVMSMAHGLEVRVPYLDEDFIDLANRINPANRFDNEQPKKLLIDSYKQLLPKAIWNRRKMGFSFPLQQWMTNHKQINDVNFYESEAAQKVIKRFKSNHVHWSKAFALYQLQNHWAETSPAHKKILFLTLQTFGSTGGIQKMSRTMAHVLQKLAHNKHWNFSFWSGYDHERDFDATYTQPKNFRGFDKKRRLFALKAVQEGIESDVTLLSHINLASIGWLIKLLKPKSKVWLIAHGIEVWRPLNFFKKKLLNHCDKIICVSNFTRQKLIVIHGVDPSKCVVLNNALDPSIKLPEAFIKPGYLLKRYSLTAQSQVIFTLTRLASTEQYKGYEQVIQAVSHLKTQFPHLKYILSGKHDEQELYRITQLIKQHQVKDNVIVTGFINETELEDHFLLADLFVLPSKKEGFGIVFIEALACGLPVICGNEDGSLDAIRNGELGTAIDVDDLNELEDAIIHHLNVPLTIEHRTHLQAKCLEYFNADNYRAELEKLLLE
jgi:asparagine synthase (glutamine-hydrolysing)